MPISDEDRKRLWARSGGQLSKSVAPNPGVGCTADLTSPSFEVAKVVRPGHGDALLAPLSRPCDRCPMDLANVDATQIRSGNVRVSRAEFLAVWREAGRRRAGDEEHEPVDWYVGAVVQTCRWVAAVPMRTALCGGLARSPVTGRACLAYGASIEAEWQAAQDQLFSDDFAGRPGWSDGVLATLRWAWCRQGPPPIEAPAP